MSLRTHRAFTLIELLVVVAVIALLIGILLPSLGRSRAAAQRVACLANMRSLETAHWSHMIDHSGRMLGTTHGGSWIDALRQHDPALLLRSPVDRSPHFEGGEPIDGVFRRTSYAINYMLSPDNPNGTARIDAVPRPAATAHFVIAVFTGPGAVADHVHPHLWWSPIPDAVPGKAATEIQTNAHGGPVGAWESVSNFGFLDGHAEARAFNRVYTDRARNSFDPRAAQ
jgi:prepilin-type N-terminal cleavage/methylation domain-containing protein/prepilin-type processing-associated H-X9-DG protein